MTDPEYEFRHDPEGLADYYRHRLAVDAENQTVYGKLISALGDLGYWIEVGSYAQSWLDRHPNDADAWSTLASSFQYRNPPQPERAEECFKRAAEILRNS